MKLTIFGCVLIFCAVAAYVVIMLLPVTSPNPMVDAAINGRTTRFSLIVGAIGAVLVLIGALRQRR